MSGAQAAVFGSLMGLGGLLMIVGDIEGFLALFRRERIRKEWAKTKERFRIGNVRDLREALGVGAGAGAFCGTLAHYAGGKMTFGIFLVACLFLGLGALKGFGKAVGLIAFTAAAALTMRLFDWLEVLGR
jgi:hypothetical protein